MEEARKVDVNKMSDEELQGMMDTAILSMGLMWMEGRLGPKTRLTIQLEVPTKLAETWEQASKTVDAQGQDGSDGLTSLLSLMLEAGFKRESQIILNSPIRKLNALKSILGR